MTTASAPHLSRRETQLLGAIAAGLGVEQFANRTGISHHTARDYHKTLYRRLGAHTGGHAVALGYRHGLLGAPCGSVPISTLVLSDLIMVAGAVAAGNLRPDVVMARRACNALGVTR